MKSLIHQCQCWSYVNILFKYDAWKPPELVMTVRAASKRPPSLDTGVWAPKGKAKAQLKKKGKSKSWAITGRQALASYRERDNRLEHSRRRVSLARVSSKSLVFSRHIRHHVPITGCFFLQVWLYIRSHGFRKSFFGYNRLSLVRFCHQHGISSAGLSSRQIFYLSC